ncbi:MAG: right-handed parallel beta-helix repeat-containing protein, partial [Bacteroidetes bacterium]
MSANIKIVNCRADNNPGDPSNLQNHSGNGILVGNCRNVLIDYCTASNNGWDMPRIGNGPVGIWAYEADSVVIQHCIAYRNKTAKGAADGGGFDLDGGVTNSIIQYCLSYENWGSGYGIFQYDGADKWYNNTVRYCVSINDGLVTDHACGMLIWNGSNVGSDFTRFQAYNNVFYNDKKYAFAFL